MEDNINSTVCPKKASQVIQDHTPKYKLSSLFLSYIFIFTQFFNILKIVVETIYFTHFSFILHRSIIFYVNQTFSIVIKYNIKIRESLLDLEIKKRWKRWTLMTLND